MGLKLKAGKTSSDGYNANTSNAYYGVVDVVNVNKAVGQAVVPFLIFKNKQSRLAEKMPVTSKTYLVEGELFDKYFSAKALGEKDLYAQAYDYILQEVKEGDALVWGDWEKDK